MSKISVGDTVVFKVEVIKRCADKANLAQFRGLVREVSKGLCLVDYSAGAKWIPEANLTPVKSVYDSRLGKSVSIVIDL